MQKLSTLAEEALAALGRKDFGKAAILYRELLKADPRQPAFWCNLSVALRRLGHGEAALGCARRAAAIDPANDDYKVNVSDCLLALDRMDETLDILSAALAKAPGSIMYRRKYASALRQDGRLEEALVQMGLARQADGSDVETNWQYAVTQLSLGRFVEGWKDFGARWKRGFLKEKPIRAPLWAGESLEGKTILLHEEQGFGDTILSARYIPLVKQRGARVIFQCRPVLHELFRELPGIDLMPLEGPLAEKFECHAPLFDLPGIFGTTLETIPLPAKLSPGKLPEAAEKLLAAGRGRIKVGIVWSGNTDFRDNFRRAVPFSRFLPLTEIPGLQFYSLQKGAPEKELHAAGAEGLVHDLGPHLTNFAETAAAVQALDLIIMTDSSVAHVAGSLGKPVWNLLHFSPFWAYLTGRADSPWYPSMRLFRQPRPGDWDSVFAEVSAALVKAVRRGI